MEILQIFQYVLSLPCNETGKTPEFLWPHVHIANPASPVLPFAYFTAWEGAKPGHCVVLGGQIEASRLLHLPGTKSNFLLTPFPEKTGYVVITKIKSSLQYWPWQEQLWELQTWVTVLLPLLFLLQNTIPLLKGKQWWRRVWLGYLCHPIFLLKLEPPLFAYLLRHCFSYPPLQVIRESFIRSDSVIRSHLKEYTDQG